MGTVDYYVLSVYFNEIRTKAFLSIDELIGLSVLKVKNILCKASVVGQTICYDYHLQFYRYQ